METATPKVVSIRNLGHARAILVCLDHVPTLFGAQPGERMYSVCRCCGRKAWLDGNRIAGRMLDERCPNSGWDVYEE